MDAEKKKSSAKNFIEFVAAIGFLTAASIIGSGVIDDSLSASDLVLMVLSIIGLILFCRKYREDVKRVLKKDHLYILAAGYLSYCASAVSYRIFLMFGFSKEISVIALVIVFLGALCLFSLKIGNIVNKNTGG